MLIIKLSKQGGNGQSKRCVVVDSIRTLLGVYKYYHFNIIKNIYRNAINISQTYLKKRTSHSILILTIHVPKPITGIFTFLSKLTV